MRIRIPSKRIRERFLIIYELKGCQKAVDFLTDYYHVRRMRIVINGRKVPRKCRGLYFRNTACFRKEGLKRRVVLHELYHHLIESKRIEISLTEEEREATVFEQRIGAYVYREVKCSVP